MKNHLLSAVCAIATIVVLMAPVEPIYAVGGLIARGAVLGSGARTATALRSSTSLSTSANAMRRSVPITPAPINAGSRVLATRVVSKSGREAVTTGIHRGQLYVKNPSKGQTLKLFDNNKKGVQTIPSDRKTGVNRAWREEARMVEETGKGTRNWDFFQKQELLKTKRVKDFQGHHLNSVKARPDLARVPSNIRFTHKTAHTRYHSKYGHDNTTDLLIHRPGGVDYLSQRIMMKR